MVLLMLVIVIFGCTDTGTASGGEQTHSGGISTQMGLITATPVVTTVRHRRHCHRPLWEAVGNRSGSVRGFGDRSLLAEYVIQPNAVHFQRFRYALL